MLRYRVPSLSQSLLEKLTFRKPRHWRTGEKVWSKKDLLLVREDQVREYLSKLNVHKSMEPYGMHPEVLRELADVIESSLNSLGMNMATGRRV